MTAELEEQEKKAEKEVPVEKASNGDEKKESQNGKGDAKEEPKEEKKGEEEKGAAECDEKPQDEEIVPQKRALPFWKRLFRGRQDPKQDPEAGTELLAKDAKPADAPPDEAAEASARKTTYWRRVAASLICIVLVLVVVSVVSVITSSGRRARGPLGEPLVVTDCGPVRGARAMDGIYVFRGLPYALPPVGDLRWRPPVQPARFSECWNGTYDAVNATAPLCHQAPIPGREDLVMSEDCLYLDVITPSLSPPTLRPVVVYIPGDSPIRGHSAADLRWRPTTAVADAEDVTFVTVGYRTNMFGFLVLDLLTDRMRPPTSGNYGLWDMVAALKWVQRNIRSFGGDPEQVTLLAHGGGATAALGLLSSRKSDGLFKQMWLTGPSAQFVNSSLRVVAKVNAGALRKLNCETLKCLMDRSAADVLRAMPPFWNSDWGSDLPSVDEEQHSLAPVADGDLLYSSPTNMWKEGDVQHVPVVIGTAAQASGSSRAVHDLSSWSWSDFSDYATERLRPISENTTAAALRFYVRNASTPEHQFHSMVSDIRTVCPMDRLHEALGKALRADSYLYLVDYQPTRPVQFSNESASVRLSVHGLDIAAIFGLLDTYVQPPSAPDLTFQRNLQDLFYSYVRDGRPSLRGETLMGANFINLIGESVRSRMTPYENCHLWNNAAFYPKYAKMN